MPRARFILGACVSPLCGPYFAVWNLVIHYSIRRIHSPNIQNFCREDFPAHIRQMRKREEPLTIWTVGHSNRSAEEFLHLVAANGIETVADVRRFPGSRRYPQFGREKLSESLADAQIEYSHFPELGGRRKPRPDSTNDAWRNAAFRAYADYMSEPDFIIGVDRLVALARRKSTAIMCAEALWWQCHRGLIADYLKAGGNRVIHILSANQSQEHPFTSAARLMNGRLSYSDSEQDPQLAF